MAIKVSGVNVIDNERNLNVGVLTATSLDVPPQPISFSPADSASSIVVTTNIQITFNVPVAVGTGNILLNKGSAGGTTHETIDVTSGNVSISGAVVTINPSSNLPTGNDIYVVVPADAFTSTGTASGNDVLNTYNFSTGPILVSGFSPADNATDQDHDQNIVITFSENISKVTTAATKYIRIRSGSASGTILQTIDVSTSAVSVSGTQATINPPSDMAYETNQYIVVDQGAFLNADGDALSGNAEINTYNFTTKPELLGTQAHGGNIICAASSYYWIVAPASSEVSRQWYARNSAVVRANAVSSCSGWYVPNPNQLQNPGNQCRAYWDSYCRTLYWSNVDVYCSGGLHFAWAMFMGLGNVGMYTRDSTRCVRAFRCVSY